jgi:hypothetical protein
MKKLVALRAFRPCVIRNSAAVSCAFILSFCTSAAAQQKILWQGIVKPEAINVYANTATGEHVTGTLQRGDEVDVILQISTSGDAWCRITFSGHSEPLGYVLCFNLERGGSARSQVAPNQPMAAQSHPTTMAAPSVKSTATAAPPGLTSDSAGLTNSDILDMYKSGLPQDVLVAKIKSSHCVFDTSPSQLTQLKAAGLADAVILAMVQAPANQPGSAPNADPRPTVEHAPDPPPAAPTTPKHPQQGGAASKTCVILKRMGPADEITSRMYSFGIRGKQFQFVEGTLPSSVNFHGRLTDHDVRTIETKGGKVVIIEPRYTVEQLDHARPDCQE